MYYGACGGGRRQLTSYLLSVLSRLSVTLLNQFYYLSCDYELFLESKLCPMVA